MARDIKQINIHNESGRISIKINGHLEPRILTFPKETASEAIEVFRDWIERNSVKHKIDRR